MTQSAKANLADSMQSVSAHIQPASLSSFDSALYLGVGEVTLRNSRASGILCGIQAPPFKKIGRRVIYLRKDLDSWLEQLPSFQNTTESSMNEVA